MAGKALPESKAMGRTAHLRLLQNLTGLQKRRLLSVRWWQCHVLEGDGLAMPAQHLRGQITDAGRSGVRVCNLLPRITPKLLYSNDMSGNDVISLVYKY